MFAVYQAPSLSGKSHVDDLDGPDENMDTGRMMFNWNDQGMGQGFTQEQVDGESVCCGLYGSLVCRIWSTM